MAELTAYGNEALRAGVRALMTPPRVVTAVARFRAGPGREDEAAGAWAFEITYYFTRAVGEAPAVTYAPGWPGEPGVYTCTGLMQTTHPGDHDPTDFTREEPWSLDYVTGAVRRAQLRSMYPRRKIWYDGRDHDA